MIIYVVLKTRTAFETNDRKYLRQEDLGSLNSGGTLVHIACSLFDLQCLAVTGLTPNWNHSTFTFGVIRVGQTGLFSCAMKHDCGLQCRCNSEDVTPYIIVINRCWALLGYIICFVPDTHASQMLSTRIKAGGGPRYSWGWKEPSGQAQSMHWHQISVKRWRQPGQRCCPVV